MNGFHLGRGELGWWLRIGSAFSSDFYVVDNILGRERNAATGIFILMLDFLKNELKFENLKQN